MNCPICKTDITETHKQYGADPKVPICQSCFLAGYAWVQDAPEILEHLERGMSLDEAMKLENYKRNQELTQDLLDFFHRNDKVAVMG